MHLMSSTGIKQGIKYSLFSKVERKKKKPNQTKLKNMFHCWQDGCVLLAGAIIAAMTLFFRYKTVASGEMV